MYKDGMSVSEVTCYFYASATYSYPRHVAYRHCYTSAAYLYGHAYSGATHAYRYSDSDTYADSGAAHCNANAHGYSYVYTKHSNRHSYEFRLRSWDGYRGRWGDCKMGFRPRDAYSNRHRFRIVGQWEQDEWIILTYI